MFHFGYHIFLSGLLAVAIRPILPERAHTIVSLKITQALDGRVSFRGGGEGCGIPSLPEQNLRGRHARVMAPRHRRRVSIGPRIFPPQRIRSKEWSILESPKLANDMKLLDARAG